MLHGYQTDCATAFLTVDDPAFDGPSARLAGVHVNSEELAMTTLSKTLIAAATLAAIATSAFSQVPWEFNPGMAYMYSGPGKMTAMAIDRKSTRLNSSHLGNSYAVFCLK